MSLHDSFIYELRDIYTAKCLWRDALPDMIRAATNLELKEGFETHLCQTQSQLDRLDQIHAMLEVSVRCGRCPTVEMIIAKARGMVARSNDPDAVDGTLMKTAQRVEDYSLAGYGTLMAYARMLGYYFAEELLTETLAEEQEVDRRLMELAQS